MHHIVTASEKRDIFQELREHWECVQLAPTKQDLADIANRLTEQSACGSEVEIDSDGAGPERDGESEEITGSSSGTELSSNSL
jgi:hypothetical protein